MGERTYSRAERIGDLIQRELAELIAREVQDPDVSQVTVSGVEMSRDLSVAKVFITLPEDRRAEDALEGLARAAGFLRRRLGHGVRLRYVPKLRFAHDDTLDKANRIDRLLDGTLDSRD